MVEVDATLHSVVLYGLAGHTDRYLQAHIVD